jgi:hypothetical protein
MTASLSKKAIGESHRPRGKCCVSWQAEAARHAVIPVPLDTDGIEERLDWRPIAFRGAPSVPAAILRACRHLAARYRRRGALPRLMGHGRRGYAVDGGRVVRRAARWPAGRAASFGS